MSSNGETQEHDPATKKKRRFRKVSREERSFDAFRLIDEVKIRPAIYDTTSEIYCDKKAKINAWEEVCEIMIPKWNSLSDEEKNSEEKLLKGKWRNIRDYFMKELKVHEQNKEYDRHNRKRRKSAYFEKLLFLLPNLENSSTRRKPQESTNESVENESKRMKQSPRFIIKRDVSMSDTEEGEEGYLTENTSAPILYKFVTTDQMLNSACETSMGSAIEDADNIVKMEESNNQRSRTDEDDFDRMFLLSLLPSMRKIPEENKLEVRIQIQQTIAAALRNVQNQN